MSPFPECEATYQSLSVEPYNLSFDQIANLTDYQIREILCRAERKRTPGSRHGTSTPKQHGSYKAWFWDVWKSRGWTEEQVEGRWREKLARGEVKNG